MKIEGHLHKNTIGIFRQRKLSATERHEIAHHLLGCDDCRRLLPRPQVADFWASVLSENRQIETKASDRLVAGRFGFLSTFRVHFGQPVALSACVLLFAVLGFSFLFFLGQVSSPIDGSEVALAPDAREYDANGISEDTSLGSQSSGTGEFEPKIPLDSLPETQNDNNASASKPDAIRRTNPRNNRFSSSKTVDRVRAAAASDTRGSIEDCRDQKSIGTLMKATERGVELRWEKLPDAIKYTVYVSDFDERLIDEYETTDNTSHVVVAELDPKITYKWKLLITLKNGRTITGTSQNFTSKGVSANRTKKREPDLAKRNAAAKIRCAERK